MQPADSPFPAAGQWGLPRARSGYPSYDLDKAKQEVAQYEQDTGSRRCHVTLDRRLGLGRQRVAQRLAGPVARRRASPRPSNHREGRPLITEVVVGSTSWPIYLHLQLPDPNRAGLLVFHTILRAGGVNINFGPHYKSQTDRRRPLHRPQVGDVSPEGGLRRPRPGDQPEGPEHLAHGQPRTRSSRQGPSTASTRPHPLGNYQPKTWLADLWVSKQLSTQPGQPPHSGPSRAPWSVVRGGGLHNAGSPPAPFPDGPAAGSSRR